ncbi:MAG TPA: hypothetical protein VIT85_05145 [Solirubrobacterales bacterium]
MRAGGAIAALKEWARRADQPTMAAFANARARLRLLASDERGMAVPVALAALIASFGLATAAVMSSVNVHTGSHRDENSKASIAAADAGASLALLRLNRFQSNLSPTTQCVGPNGEKQTPAGGWCPPTTAETLGGATFTYQISAYTAGQELNVVATGSDGVVSRRVNVGLISVNGKNVFADEHLIGKDGIQIKGNVDIETDIGTNGKIEKDGGSGVVCGHVRHGIGQPMTWKPNCGKEVLEGEKELPPITPPSNIATVNSNCRLVPNCLKPTDVDTWAKHPNSTRTSTEPWNSGKSIINIGNNGSLTMGGADYYVCGLAINGALIMAAGAKIRIFIRKPSECGMASGATQVDMTAGGSIVATGYGSSNFNAPAIYMLGNGSVSLLGHSGTDHLILYAPESAVELGGKAEWIGMIAGKTISMHGNPSFKSDPNMTPPDITLRGLWQRTRYVECPGPAGSVPNANC